MKTSKSAQRRRSGHGNGRLIVMIALITLAISSIVIVPVAVYKNTEMASSGANLPPSPAVQSTTGEPTTAGATSTQQISGQSERESQVDELGKEREKSAVKSVGAGREYKSSYVRVKFNDPPPRPQPHVDPPFTGGDKGDKPLW